MSESQLSVLICNIKNGAMLNDSKTNLESE